MLLYISNVAALSLVMGLYAISLKVCQKMVKHQKLKTNNDKNDEMYFDK